LPPVPLKKANAPQFSVAMHWSQQSEKLDGVMGDELDGPNQMSGMGPLQLLPVTQASEWGVNTPNQMFLAVFLECFQLDIYLTRWDWRR
jgi:hypothetical protein